MQLLRMHTDCMLVLLMMPMSMMQVLRTCFVMMLLALIARW